MTQEKLNNTHELVVLANDINYLNNLESGDFPITDKLKRIETVQKLRIVFKNLWEQYNKELSDKKSEKKLKALMLQMRRCSLYIDQLKEGHLAVWSNYANATRYLGMTLVAPDMVQAMMISLNQSDNGITTVEDYIGAINAQRSAHTWGYGFIGTILQKLPGEFATPLAAQPYTGPLSFMLYFTRLGIEFRLLYQNSHTSLEFQTQWAQRKFVILNDFIWGFANLASYVCLTILRLKTLGSLGNADFFFNTLNVGLMVVDFMLLMLRFHETQTKHNAEIAFHDEQLSQVEPGSPLYDQRQKLKAQCEANSKYQQFKFLNQGAYHIAMIVGFSLMTGLTAGMLPVVGAAVCFFFSTALSVFDGVIDIMQMKASVQNATDDYKVQLIPFENASDDTLKKLAYLEIKKSVATTVHQENLVSFQQKKLIINVFLKAVAPALVFGAFAFLTFGIGLTAVATSLSLALAIHVILKQNEPKAEVLPELDEGEYNAFIQGGMTREFLIEQLKTPQVNHTKGLSFFTNDQDVGPLTEDELSPPHPV